MTFLKCSKGKNKLSTKTTLLSKAVIQKGIRDKDFPSISWVGMSMFQLAPDGRGEQPHDSGGDL